MSTITLTEAVHAVELVRREKGGEHLTLSDEAVLFHNNVLAELDASGGVARSGTNRVRVAGWETGLRIVGSMSRSGVSESKGSDAAGAGDGGDVISAVLRDGLGAPPIDQVVLGLLASEGKRKINRVQASGERAVTVATPPVNHELAAQVEANIFARGLNRTGQELEFVLGEHPRMVDRIAAWLDQNHIIRCQALVCATTEHGDIFVPCGNAMAGTAVQLADAYLSTPDDGFLAATIVHGLMSCATTHVCLACRAALPSRRAVRMTLVTERPTIFLSDHAQKRWRERGRYAASGELRGHDLVLFQREEEDVTDPTSKNYLVMMGDNLVGHTGTLANQVYVAKTFIDYGSRTSARDVRGRPEWNAVRSIVSLAADEAEVGGVRVKYANPRCCYNCGWPAHESDVECMAAWIPYGAKLPDDFQAQITLIRATILGSSSMVGRFAESASCDAYSYRPIANWEVAIRDYLRRLFPGVVMYKGLLGTLPMRQCDVRKLWQPVSSGYLRYQAAFSHFRTNARLVCSDSFEVLKSCTLVAAKAVHAHAFADAVARGFSPLFVAIALYADYLGAVVPAKIAQWALPRREKHKTYIPWRDGVKYGDVLMSVDNLSALMSIWVAGDVTSKSYSDSHVIRESDYKGRKACASRKLFYALRGSPRSETETAVLNVILQFSGAVGLNADSYRNEIVAVFDRYVNAASCQMLCVSRKDARVLGAHSQPYCHVFSALAQNANCAV